MEKNLVRLRGQRRSRLPIICSEKTLARTANAVDCEGQRGSLPKRMLAGAALAERRSLPIRAIPVYARDLRMFHPGKHFIKRAASDSERFRRPGLVASEALQNL